MEDPRTGKDPEMKQGGREFRSTQGVEQADQHEGNNVFQVIQVTPDEQKNALPK